MKASRGRLVAAQVLVVVASIAAAISLLAGYIRYQAFDNSTFDRTAADLISNDALREQIAASMVDELYANVDVQSALAEQLPPDQRKLAAPLAAASREFADRAARRLLERPRPQALWVQTLSRSHAQLLTLLDDKSTLVREDGGLVILDLSPLVVQLGDRVAVFGPLAQRLPADTGRIEIMKADQLQQAQTLTRLLKRIAFILWLLPLALATLAVWLARGNRARTVRGLAIGAIVAGILVLATRRLAGSYLVDHLVKSESVRPAANDAWSILTRLLADGAWTLIVAALVTLVGLWLAGDTPRGTAARARLAPYLAQPKLAFGAVAAGLLGLVWWGPTPQTRRWFLVLVAALLLSLGVEALRRISARETERSTT
jgi:hypothetical protein